jgi:hypothetical protein
MMLREQLSIEKYLTLVWHGYLVNDAYKGGFTGTVRT